MKIAVTGHRPSKLGNDYDMTGPLSAKLALKIEDVLHLHTPSIGYTGMALGVDMIFAQACIACNVPFIAAIPFKGQEKLWPKASQQLYFDILQQARSIMIVDTNTMVDWFGYIDALPTMYLVQKMDRRNRWLVDQLSSAEDRLLAVWDGSNGGTASCVRYASLKRKHIIQINPKTF